LEYQVEPARHPQPCDASTAIWQAETEEIAVPEKPPELSVPRPDEAAPLDEMRMGRAWLQHLRDSAIFKLEDLTDDQLRWRPAPTANSLGVVVVHLGYAERLWLRAICAGEPMDMGWRAHMFELPDGWSVEEVVAFYRGESALADAVLDRVPSFDLPAAGDLRPTTVRWAVFHLIEETARHVGHMDITRELLDGRIGR
jgi:uncharacterized damage-inducible protein DinB